MAWQFWVNCGVPWPPNSSCHSRQSGPGSTPQGRLWQLWGLEVVATVEKEDKIGLVATAFSLSPRSQCCMQCCLREQPLLPQRSCHAWLPFSSSPCSCHCWPRTCSCSHHCYSCRCCHHSCSCSWSPWAPWPGASTVPSASSYSTSGARASGTSSSGVAAVAVVGKASPCHLVAAADSHSSTHIGRWCVAARCSRSTMAAVAASVSGSASAETRRRQ